MTPKYDLLIIGGGISGAALLHCATRYTNIRRIGLIEKYDGLASVNTHGRHNSQTLHCGDIETNYTLDKALSVKRAADMIVHYARAQPNTDRIVYKFSKMVLGVGERETQALRDRFAIFGSHYAAMRLLEKPEIALLEPNVAKIGNAFRTDDIVALGSVSEYCAVDYAALAHSFVYSAVKEKTSEVELHLGTTVERIDKHNDVFQVRTQKGVLLADAVVASAGGHSLLLAQQMGYGLNYSVFPVAGSFYFTPKVLNGKVYTVQNDKLPFAAIHGDPDVLVEGKTRFGPTAVILPLLERYNYKTLPEFFKVLRFDRDVLQVFLDLLKEPEIRNYMLKNALFEVPLLRRALFLRDARKIVPSLKLKDIQYAKRFGGIRPQLVDKEHRALRLGEAKINPHNGIIFNMTPSPGGTSCLYNAEIDLRSICTYLGKQYDEARMTRELVDPSMEPVPGALTDHDALIEEIDATADA
ncbi:MAG: FAD-dependent oxidoreductase [Thiotrichales bacterium]